MSRLTKSLLLILLPLTHPLSPLTIYHTPTHTNHYPPPGTYHAEIPLRLTSIVSKLVPPSSGGVVRDLNLAWNDIRISDVTPSDFSKIETSWYNIHSPEYIESLKNKVGGLDTDTYMSPNSYRHFYYAQTSWLKSLHSAATSTGPTLSITRPPGHHATTKTGMGFCPINFCAVAVTSLLSSPFFSGSVMVLDIDVHFGNGIADIVKGKDRVKYASVHQDDIYPGDTKTSASGNVWKLALGGGTEGGEWRVGVKQGLDWLLEGADKTRDVLVVCVGYDGLGSDPLAGMNLKPGDYGDVAGDISRSWDTYRTAWGLEGGYDCGDGGMPDAVEDTIRGICGEGKGRI